MYPMLPRQFRCRPRPKLRNHDAARDGRPFDRISVAEQWLRTLQRSVLMLFDDVFVGAGSVSRQQPKRIANARRNLLSERKGQDGLWGKKLRESLGLPVAEPAAAKKAKRTSKTPPSPSPNDAGEQANRRTT